MSKTKPDQETPEGKELLVKGSRAMELPVDDDFADFANDGMQNVTAQDILVPRLTIIQALSPQLKKKDPNYIPGAEVGHICDVGTGELFQDGILFLPVYYRKDYLEWAPRASGGGLVNVHSDPKILDTCRPNDKKQPTTPEGNIIQETAQFYGFNISADFRPSFIPMASTQLKKGRKWLTLAGSEKLHRGDGSSYTPPLWYRVYSLTTAEESNSQGDWMGWKIERNVSMRELDTIVHVDWQELKQKAVRFSEQLALGQARGDHDEPEAGVVEGTAEAAM